MQREAALPMLRRTNTRGSAAKMPEQNAATERQAHERFAALVEPELDVLLRVAISLVDQRADAEDLVQDTLLRAYRSIDTFDGRHPRAWLLTILRNARINSTRRRRPQLLDEPDAIERVDGWPGTDPSAGADQVVVDDMFDSAVAAAVRALPLGFRRVVYLVDVQGLSYADCARLLDVPEGTVMSRLHRARKRVRARLAECGLGPRTVAGT
jgi:RNA polymerase sigma-70 factor, ECF subfamily